VLAGSESVLFVQQDYHRSQGCWHGITVDVHELRLCRLDSGEVTILTNELASALVPSPDGQAYAYLTIDLDALDDQEPILAHVFRIGRDGTAQQQLDGPGWPPRMPGARNLAWPEPDWLTLELWDGSENGWHPYRLAADGRVAFPE
jgi:hypothetical protein